MTGKDLTLACYRRTQNYSGVGSDVTKVLVYVVMMMIIIGIHMCVCGKR
jgi:hypothetical protein